MSQNIIFQLSKKNINKNLENLLSSYKSLEIILSPNLSGEHIIFMKYIIDIIISQLKIFSELLNINEEQKIFELININNQNLSKKIINLYELTKLPKKYTKDSILLRKEKNGNINLYFNKKKTGSFEEKKKLINIIDSDNYNLNNKIKEISEKFIENESSKESKINKYEKMADKKIYEKEKLYKNNKEVKEKLKNKEILIKRLKEQEEEKGKDVREIAKKFIRKHKQKLKENNKNNFKNYSKIFKNKQKNKLKSIKFENICSQNELNKVKEEKKISKIKNGCNNRTPSTMKMYKYKYFLLDDIFEEINNSKINKKNYKRKDKKSKTFFNKSLKLSDIYSIEKNRNISSMNNYNSSNYTNRNKNQKPKNLKSHQIYSLEQKKFTQYNKIDKNNKYIYNYKDKNNYITKTESNFKTYSKNLNKENFSLDEFLIPYNSQKGEELYLTRYGKVSISKKQKDIVEDCVNNFIYEKYKIKNKLEKNNILTKKINNNFKENILIKNKIGNVKINKFFKTENSSINNDLNDMDLLKSLSSSIQGNIDKFYTKEKKTSKFDKNIVKVNNNIIDNYKELKNKEDLLTFKSRSKSKSILRKKVNNILES